MKNKIKINKNVLLVFLSLIFVFSTFKIGIFLVEIGRSNYVNSKLIKNVIKVEKMTFDNEEVKKYTIDYKSLLNTNEDVRFWIRFNEDKVNYPVVQSTDNSYYLTHDINKNKNAMGAIFMDYRNKSLNDKNLVLFGHSATDGTMFGSLKDALKQKFYDDEANRTIEIIDMNNNMYHYEIFSVYTIVKEEYYITTNFNSDKEFTTFLSTVKNRSVVELDTNLSTSDRILSLSTCDGVGATNKRLVIHAKLKRK